MPSAAARAAFASMNDEGNDPLSGASIDLLLATASDIVEKIVSEASFFDPERDRLFPHLDDSEITIGRVLGRGGFCVVNEIKKIKLLSSSRAAEMDEEDESSKDEAFTRKFLQERCIRNGDARYAIKILAPECRTEQSRFLKGTVDLAVEARFLAVLEHPHIIKMRAVSSVSPFEEGYFLILDRLYDTLEQRFKKWSRAFGKTKGVIGKMTGGKKKKEKLFLDRIHVSHDLAAAMKYMHSHNIIYRDLKPDNCGFDVRDDIKIFDMGLAKELNEKDMTADGTYKLTGFTGSLRYMAPEVAKNIPYNLSADVYSFGMLFWHIMELEPPFVTYSCKMHNEKVVEKGYRPMCNKAWPPLWSGLMKKCWSANPNNRPTFEQVTTILREESVRLDPYHEDSQLDASQRSMSNLRGKEESAC